MSTQNVLAFPHKSTPAQMHQIIDTFSRELHALRADPMAPDVARREELYVQTIGQYSTWLTQHPSGGD